MNELINLGTSLTIFGALVDSRVADLSENILDVWIWVIEDLINKLLFRVFGLNLRLRNRCSFDFELHCHLSLKTCNLCPSILEVLLHGGHAIMRPNSIDMNRLLTCLAVDLLLAALLVTVEFHILAQDSKAASEFAWLNNFFTGVEMLDCSLVAVDTFTGVIRALEFHVHHVLFHSSVHLSPLNLVVAEAFLWATFVFLGPRSNAG